MNDTLEMEKAFIQEVKKHFTMVYTRGNNDEELYELIDLLHIEHHKKYLDLGTGSGYVAFQMADRFPYAIIEGLDIVEEMRIRNQNEAKTKGLSNVSFLKYDGITFPVEDDCYDGIITRYSLHHFPNIERTASEMDRVLKTKSTIVICDCIPTKDDHVRFIDSWMRVLGDGHVSFRTVEEYQKVLGKYNFKLKQHIQKHILCPRENSDIYRRLLNEHKREADSYHYHIDGKTIWLDEPVVHLLFER